MALSVSSRRILKRPTTGTERVVKHQRVRTMLVLAILCVALVAILIGLGFLYTWFISNQVMPGTALTDLPQKPVEIQKPVTRTNQRVSVAVSNLSSPVAPGDSVDLSIRTNIDAICTIEILAPTTKLVDINLSAKAADEFGIVSWAWQVPKETKDGSWPITVTCKNREYSGVVRAALVIKR
jgi:hypothetical protein